MNSISRSMPSSASRLSQSSPTSAASKSADSKTGAADSKETKPQMEELMKLLKQLLESMGGKDGFDDAKGGKGGGAGGAGKGGGAGGAGGAGQGGGGAGGAGKGGGAGGTGQGGGGASGAGGAGQGQGNTAAASGKDGASKDGASKSGSGKADDVAKDIAQDATKWNYDNSGGKTWDQTVGNENTFDGSKSGVCTDMALEAAQRFEAAGVDARVQMGETDKGNHAWVEYKGDDGQWKKFDPTAAAGTKDVNDALNPDSGNAFKYGRVIESHEEVPTI